MRTELQRNMGVVDRVVMVCLPALEEKVVADALFRSTSSSLPYMAPTPSSMLLFLRS